MSFCLLAGEALSVVDSCLRLVKGAEGESTDSSLLLAISESLVEVEEDSGGGGGAARL